MTVVAVARTPRRPLVGWRPGPLAWIAIGFLAVVVAAAVAAPLIAPYGPNSADFNDALAGPSLRHILGADELGRDTLSRLIYGGRVSLVGVCEAVVLLLVLGLGTGLLAGYLGGPVDDALVWISELSFATPQIVVVLAVLALFPNNDTVAMVVFGVVGAPGLAIQVRGATKAVRREQYIAAATVSGLGTLQILWRHVLPRVAGPVIVLTTFFAGSALAFQTGLDFLGLGTRPPTASWGAMVAEASQNLSSDPFMAVPSGLTITLVIVAFGIVGDAVRDTRAGLSAPRGVVIAASKVAARSSGSSRPTLSPPDPSAVLSVRSLSAAVLNRDGQDLRVIEDVSFDLHRGETLGIVGESGSGKTMLALALMGMLPAGISLESGEIYFDGASLHGASERALSQIRGSGIGMIFQEPIASLDPSFTVGAQLAEVIRRHHGGSRTDARREALGLLERVRLPDPAGVAKRYAHQLSGGMAQRVSIAAALAANPRVLIADEPTTALDVTVQAEILDLLRSVQVEFGLAMILVSHDWGVIANACDSVAVMYAGEVIEQAGIQELFSEPRHPYTLGLMESDPHRSAIAGAALPSIPGSIPVIGSRPSGCRFAPRCRFATSECSERRIPMIEIDGGRLTRCIHEDQLTAQDDERSRIDA